MMISLLDSGSHEIVYTSCGVLINMMVDCEKRAVLKEEGGIKKYVIFVTSAVEGEGCKISLKLDQILF